MRRRYAGCGPTAKCAAQRLHQSTGVRTSPAVTRDDLTYQDDTGNGESRGFGYKWLEKTYDFDITSGPDGLLYIDIGVWGTWETYRAYYIDHLQVTITEN